MKRDKEAFATLAQSALNLALGQAAGLLAQRVQQYANVADEVAKIMRERDEPDGARLASMVAGGACEVANYLRRNDARDMWDDLQHLARGRTWLVGAFGLCGGLMISRALRSSLATG